MVGRTGIQWAKVIVAGVFTEVSLVVIIGAVVLAYRGAASPSDVDFAAFADRMGSSVGVYGGALAAFVFAMWVGRPLRARFLIHGVLVGCVAAALHMGLAVASGARVQTDHVLADVLKVAGGALGGHLAARRYRQFHGSRSARRATRR